jgi:hypothetical protein
LAEADRWSNRGWQRPTGRAPGLAAADRRSTGDRRWSSGKVSTSNPKRPKIAPSYGFLVEQGMEELDQLELAVDKLMQGMKDLN